MTNPPENIEPCSPTWLVALDCAGTDTRIRPLPVHPRSLETMSVPEQVFAITDFERVARGLPPFAEMTARLDALAQVGANTEHDPMTTQELEVERWWGSTWGDGSTSALDQMYRWLYRDGLYTSQIGGNLACLHEGDPGCWGHRDNLLHTAIACQVGQAGCGRQCLTGRTPALLMGAAIDAKLTDGSITTFEEVTCGGTPSEVTYTWAEARARATAPTPPAT